MTSPNASPQKPSERTPQKSGTPAKVAPVAPATPQKVPSPARSVAKWQWQESTVPTSAAFGWTRVWRLSKLLLQANC